MQVYEAVFLMATRQFKRAAELLLDAIATFTRCSRQGVVFSSLPGIAELVGAEPQSCCWASLPHSPDDGLHKLHFVIWPAQLQLPRLDRSRPLSSTVLTRCTLYCPAAAAS